ncbi:hypothetical protein AQPE_0374 [Aquipluma nitroreducens]|uniref:Uncharacterized protein n=1 Tax=Aquipluma nitroreducens TaxID=2010828 RepID=A0A5K7S409_9BACT|nr:CARDB domain-containing protein [Aquipluma nitroreducens]BBE16237.1 hypothetical protein AQPE_0374 [Aquipluma nitroreducens]
MKKSIFKTIAAIMLFSFALSAVLLNSCKKNVGDVYDYAPVVLNPDFELLTVDYAFDNEALNSESGVSFKVAYKNIEITQTAYSSVLNFYVDGNIQQSALLKDLAGNTKYETVFDWQAIAGQHDFKFEINLSSNGSKIVEEANTTNNSQTTSLNIAVKNLVAASEVVVEPSVVNQAIAADPEGDVANVLDSEGIAVATSVDAVKTTYSDNTTAIVAAVEKNDGTIDETKVILSVTSNSGVHQGQKQEANTTLVIETLVTQEEISFYNAKEKLTYKDGTLSYTSLKNAKVGCTEPSNLQAFFANQVAINAFTDAVLSAIKQLGVANGLAAAPEILISVLEAFNLTQGNIDNPPTYTVEITNSSTICSDDCITGLVVKTYSYPGFVLHFSDDRGTIPSITKEPNCSKSNNGTYTFEDCGGNKVSYIFNSTRPVIATKTPCVANVHN